ncbi:MAG: indole-3-glycerol-phosphate synthase [Bacteroidales bacterium]|nr:indole-3-glycerol-phosphate synthase [Bacteroidales bacterium]
MNILEKIVFHKRKSLVQLKEKFPVSSFEKNPLFQLERPSFFDCLNKKGPSVITEFKRKSPSKGDINPEAQISSIIPQYSNAGASAISVLTDIHFSGELKDLNDAALISNIPLLRKDFIVDEYQILEAKAHGASAILLIATVLSKKEIFEFTKIAHRLRLDVLLELHDESELSKIGADNNIIGVNNRNLSSFEVNTDKAISLLGSLDKDVIKVAESGIQDIDIAIKMFRAGFNAFLIGELFMRNENPGEKVSEFIRMLTKKLNYEG